MTLFPKTFMYVFSLMATIALISHALFFFLMPIVYTSQKEGAFKNVEAQLMEELRTVSNPSEDKIESIVRKYAQQSQIGIFVYYAGYIYNFMVNANSVEDNDTSIQEEFESN